MCCLEKASPLSCVLFLRSTVAGAVPGSFSSWGISGDAGVSGIVLGIFSWADGDTSSFSTVWGDTGAVLGLFFCDVGVTGGFSRVWLSAAALSRMDGALLRAAAGLMSPRDDASC